MTNPVARGRFTIVNEKGMHARAASVLVRLASKFPCEIQLSGPEAEAVSAKSVMGVLLLCGAKGTSCAVWISEAASVCVTMTTRWSIRVRLPTW